jgi:uroporphyrin-III C-methyltransferase
MSEYTHSPLVSLVGAGPGDPELLTIKALNVLQSADVVLVDDLVNDEICKLINKNARIIYVGKRGGCKSTPQAFIEKLLIQEARSGNHVVRLKGGDPFIFGRGGEEVESLQRAGIQVQVVNGITSGLAAVSSLGISLTHREHAHGVIFLTGHQKSSKVQSESDQKESQPGLNWQLIGLAAQQAKLTLVIYMGIKGAREIELGLLKSMNPLSPVGIIQNATLRDQRNTVTCLNRLCSTIDEQKLASPSVIVIGDILKGLSAYQDSLEYNLSSPCENNRLVVG